MVYVLRDVDGTILSYGEKDDWLPAPGQTVEAVAGTLAEYAARFRLSTDKTAIRADGSDTATVTVSTSPPLARVGVRVGDLTEVIALSGGVGSFQVAAETAGLIVITAADGTQFCRAGGGTVAIIAEEVA